MIFKNKQAKWVGLLLLAGLLGVGNGLVLGIALEKAKAKQRAVHKELQDAQAALRQIQQDRASIEKMKDEIDAADVKRYLLPVDRLRIAKKLEERADEMFVTHFSYTLSPERPTTFDTVSAGKQFLATSTWTLTGNTPTDLDAFAFVDSVMHTMPGRVVLRRLSVEKIGDAEAPLTEANIRVTANGEWLSNGASPFPVETLP